jgi:hypothetical protein
MLNILDKNLLHKNERKGAKPKGMPRILMPLVRQQYSTRRTNPRAKLNGA